MTFKEKRKNVSDKSDSSEACNNDGGKKAVKAGASPVRSLLLLWKQKTSSLRVYLPLCDCVVFKIWSQHTLLRKVTRPLFLKTLSCPLMLCRLPGNQVKRGVFWESLWLLSLLLLGTRSAKIGGPVLFCCEKVSGYTQRHQEGAQCQWNHHQWFHTVLLGCLRIVPHVWV